MNVLICGAGIAGPTLAYWLLQHGVQATIVEKLHRPEVRVVDDAGKRVAGFPGEAFTAATAGMLHHPQAERAGCHRVRSDRTPGRSDLR